MQVAKLKLARSMLLATASGTVLMLLPAPAAAQTESAEVRTAPDDIIVTARKRTERLADVPISITALDDKEMARRGARNIEDVGRITPGLVLVPGGFGVGSTPLIRGVSSFVGAATVGVYIDDVPVQFRNTGFAASADPYLFDIDRVEVLRGPQGTLFGASSMGGTIRYVTRAPSYTELSGQSRLEVAGVESGEANYEAAGAVGGPIIADKLAVRVSAAYRHEGGFVDRRDRTTNRLLEENIDDSDTFSLNATLGWRATENLEIKPSIYYQRVERQDTPIYMPALPKFSQFNTSRQPSTDYFYVPSLTANYDFEKATLTSITSYLKKKSDAFTDYSTVQANLVIGPDFIPGFENYISTSRAIVDQTQFTQEVRLASNGTGRLSWIIGGFYLRTDDKFTQFVADETLDPLLVALTGAGVETILGIPLIPVNGVYQGDTSTIDKQIAGFGELNFAITPALKATVGLRISRTTVDFSRLTQGPLNGGTQFVEGSQSETPVTPKFGLSYQLQDGSLLYATVQRGFRPGSVNSPVPEARCAADLAALGGTPPTEYGADSLWSYEIGAKTDLFDRRLSINASAYILDWTNIQQGVSLPNCGFGYVDNLGTARSRGFEFEAQAKPVDWITLGVRIGYVNAELTSDILAPPNPNDGSQAVISRRGDPLVGIPEWTASLSGEFTYPVSPTTQMYLRADYQYIGSAVRTQPEGRIGYNAAEFAADSYDRASLRGGILLEPGWDISVFVENLANNQPVLVRSTALSPTTGTLRETTLRPRTIGLNVAKRF